MADLSKMSNEELLLLANGEHPSQSGQKVEPIKTPVADLSKVKTEDLIKMLDTESPSNKYLEAEKNIVGTVAKPIVALGRAVDSVTGAPTRAAIGAIQAGENPFRAFGRQFAANPDEAPTGKDIAKKAGLSANETMIFPFKGPSGENIKVSPAGAAGFGIDVAADPTNFIPVGAAVKGVGKTALEGVSLASKAAAFGTDAITGTRLATGALESTKNIAQSAKLAASNLFNPKIAQDFAEMTDIAIKNGIDPKILPEAIEFGPNSFITRAVRHKAEGPLGQETLNKFENAIVATKDATEKKISEIAGGPVLSKQEAGAYIRQAFDQSVDDFFSKVEVTHDKIIKDYPGLTLTTGFSAGDEHIDKLNSTLNGIEKFAKGRIKRGISSLQEEQGKRLLKTVDAIRATNGSYLQTVEALRDIGDAAFKSQNTMAAIPADVEKLRNLYGVLNDTLLESVKKNVSQDLSNDLFFANKEMSNFIGKKNPLAQVIGNPSISDEAVFRSLVENGDSNKLQNLSAILGPDRIQPVKGAWLNSLIKRDINESFSFKPIIGAMRNKKIVLENLLSPNEIKDFGDLVKLGDRFGNPILSTSGTGASNVFRDVVDSVKSGIGNDAFIETAKRRAREAELLKSSQQPSGQLLNAQNGTIRNLILPDRSRLDKTLKASQVISSQDEKRKAKQNAFQRRLNQN